MFQFDTIAAISTALGEGAIGIVRLSGEEAVTIAEKLVDLMGKKTISTVDSHTINYGHVIDRKAGTVVDEVMVSVMRAPRTFTREDVIEINCHGGIVAVNRILELALEQGARLAEPGEFTKRAFLNGRIDLSQAEAVMDLVRAKSDRAMDLAMGQLEGKLSNKIRELRQEMLTALAQIEVTIDYPEYDEAEEMTLEVVAQTAESLKKKITRLLQQSKQGKILREGIETAIVGRPNVGKSSLLNVLLQEDKAIVTDIAGTTRDTIEETITINGIPLKLIDTAGIRETTDIVEQIGVERSQKAIDQSDLVLLLLNQSETLTEQDQELLERTRHKKRIIILNKTDLPRVLDQKQLDSFLNETDHLIQTSMLTQMGIEALEQAISELFMSGQVQERDVTYLSNARHINLLKEANKALDDVLAGVEMSVGIDLIQIDLTRCWDLLGEITGDAAPDELLTQLFSQFCLGK
ncbi:tRNA uridine-5-carboxymethylaminomethyl(34) synthesis GTPase MnmE [Atopobacter phocae]|uniref:tRNA uridine-5-carboxymethylaminomethyl(34) synthesis GTPase MnmE n=1 Tax=Atopobacter phocae TaxID=136492 RepID=UPI000470B719|nr:tRNA uridine-5-carboxymethylaminomethyl(34) synthesis GTPase MnmE [Atopobacter phocae]